MGLDFVLEHPDYRFLATEHEKVAFFSGDLGLAKPVLPTKIYRSKLSDSVTKRRFVDKFPIFVCAQGNPASPEVGFCYIDEGAVATPGFETYLEQYAGLFTAVGRFRLVYVATSGKNFPEAQKAVERFFGPAVPSSSGGYAPSPENLAECFRLEHLLRVERFGELNAALLDRLKQLRKVFQGSRYEELFALWMTLGDRVLHEHFKASEARLRAPKCSLSLHRLAYDYDLFGYGN